MTLNVGCAPPPAAPLQTFVLESAYGFMVSWDFEVSIYP